MITVGPDGALWFTENGGIGRISTSGEITEYPLPANHGGIGITSGPDGRVWFVDYLTNNIGAITTDGTLTEYPVNNPQPPPGALNLAGITVGPDGALWFTELGANKIGRITTAGMVTEYVVPTPNSSPGQITLGPDFALWFTEGAVGKIGRIVLPDTTSPLITVSAAPRVLWPPNGQMMLVIVSGRITDTGSGLVASSVEYAVSDEYRQVQPSGHMALDSVGNYSFTVLLRASREGSDTDGRRYYIRVSARDNAGNRGVKWSNVIVPHDRR
jgi:streptogramin lyase